MNWSFLTGCYGWQPTELWRTDESRTRLWLYILKGILIVPAAMGTWSHWENWREVEKFEELKHWPYDVHGDMAVAWWWGFIALVSITPWSFISMLLIRMWHGRWLFLWGLLDLFLALFLCYGVNLQDSFLPNHYIACNGNKAMTWQVVDGHDSLFQAISSLEVDNGDAKKICKALVGNWTLGVMVATIQFLVAYVGIFSDENPFSLLNAYRPAYWLLYLFIIYPILWTRDVVLPFCRIHFSRSKKSLYRLRKTTDFELPEITQYQAPDRQFDMPKTKLMDVLFIEHILLDVVDNMHYEDVVNLSLACRAVREAVFPRNDLTMRIPKLKETCCQRGTRRACLYCNKIICFWCARRPHLPALPGRRHTTACMPYCRTCYFTSFSQHPSGYKRPCPGHNDKVPDQQQELCPTCAQKWSPKMKICRERRFAQLARDIAFGRVPLDPPIPKTQSSDVDASGTATASDAADMSGEERERDIENMVQRDKPIDGRHCGKCKIELGSGMRWWVCGICRGECRDSIHPAFVKRREMWDVDVEKAEDKDVLGEKERRGPWWRRWLRK